MGSVQNGGVHAPQALVPMTAVIHTVSKYTPTLILCMLFNDENFFVLFYLQYPNRLYSDYIWKRTQIILINMLIIFQNSLILLRIRAEVLIMAYKTQCDQAHNIF